MNSSKWVALLICALPLGVMAQQNYTIKGKAGTLDKPAKALLRLKYDGQDHIDTVAIKKGEFEFTGTIPSPMEAHILVLHDDKPIDPTHRVVQDIKAFLIEGTTIKIETKDSIKNAVITGSPLNAESDRVNALLKPIYDEYQALNKEFDSKSVADQQDPTYIRSLEERAAAIHAKTIEAKLAYVAKHPKSFMSLMALNSTLAPGFDAIKMEQIFLGLDPSLQQAVLGKEVALRIATVKKTQEGVEAPDFTQPDINGHMVQLSDYRGKYVLIDFWASWCAPCRRENPNLVKAYATYKDKGFEILGVSMDKAADKEKWLKAIEADGLTWTQVGDLKGWENTAGVLYEVKAIPTNFLVDPSGKIVAKELRGAALQKKLAEIFNNN